SGATNATLALNALGLADMGQYTVVVGNSLGAVTYTTEVGIGLTTVQAELKLSDKVLRLWLPTVTDQTTVVEASTDHLHWAPVYFYSPQQNNFFDLSITNSAQQFFRTRSFTNPPQ
ncbi:MAG TPA: hypothetical protein VNT99_09160, partial [Methylomirabilota bacterium]|nr:hypothetical protein [Methylomirabilota bacterium]